MSWCSFEKHPTQPDDMFPRLTKIIHSFSNEAIIWLATFWNRLAFVIFHGKVITARSLTYSKKVLPVSSAYTTCEWKSRPRQSTVCQLYVCFCLCLSVLSVMSVRRPFGQKTDKEGTTPEGHLNAHAFSLCKLARYLQLISCWSASAQCPVRSLWIPLMTD